VTRAVLKWLSAGIFAVSVTGCGEDLTKNEQAIERQVTQAERQLNQAQDSANQVSGAATTLSDISRRGVTDALSVAKAIADGSGSDTGGAVSDGIDLGRLGQVAWYGLAATGHGSAKQRHQLMLLLDRCFVRLSPSNQQDVETFVQQAKGFSSWSTMTDQEKLDSYMATPLRNCLTKQLTGQ